MQLFRRFNEVGVTVVIATHDIHIIQQFGLRQIVLDHGRMSGADPAQVAADTVMRAEPRENAP